MKYLADTVTLRFLPERCTRCGRCLEVCPRGVFVLGRKTAEISDRDLCIECGACARNCPEAALEVRAGVGCAEAVINGMLTGGEPTCGCGGSSCCEEAPAASRREEAPAVRESSCCGGAADKAPGSGCTSGASSRDCC
jgi:NAD-dependent dihydropyrimidine dehydrogenase PreA subunit